ncbi:MAG: ABC transporter permease [Micavibrio sp.]|nr:ABC transporter permease [Micavibrio sp.]
MQGVKRKTIWLAAPFLSLMGIFFILPLLLIVAYSFLQAGDNGGVLWHFSLEGYTQILYSRDLDDKLVFDSGYLEIFGRSVALAALCTFICLLVGFPMAYHMATRPPARRNLWILLVTIPFWTNLLIRTYAWMLILRSDGLLNRSLISLGIVDADRPLELLYNNSAIAIGLLYSYLPFMVLPIYSNLERMDWRLAEAASDLYATRWQTLRHVILPLARPGIVSGCVLVFTPSIGSYLTSNLLGGGKTLMLGNLIEQQFGFSSNWPFGSAISVVLMAVVMICLIIMARRGGRGLEDLL